MSHNLGYHHAMKSPVYPYNRYLHMNHMRIYDRGVSITFWSSRGGPAQKYLIGASLSRFLRLEQLDVLRLRVERSGMSIDERLKALEYLHTAVDAL